MKKNGFTLAEVLIVLGIIGVVAALTIPNFIVACKYKELGTKLAKFQNTMEKAATEYVISNDQQFGQDKNVSDQVKLQSFIDEDLLYKGVVGENTITTQIPSDIKPTTIGNSFYALKDNTKVRFAQEIGAGDNLSSISTSSQKVIGQAANCAIFFDSNINGLGENAHTVFKFGLTSKGFVLPDTTDTCLTAIVNNKYNVKSDFYKKDGVCMKKEW